MKYRRNKVKREHGIIQDALAWLEELTRHPEVSDIIPGVIEVSRSPGRGIVYKYETQTGCKLLLKSNGSIQEAFVVTKDPAWVKDWVEKRFPSPAGGEEKNKREEKVLWEETRTREETSSRENKEVRQREDFHRAKEAGPPSKTPGRKKEVRATGQARERHVPLRQHTAKVHSTKAESVSRWTDECWISAGDLEAVNVGEQINPTMARALRTLQKQLKESRKDKGKGQAGDGKRR